ncbi:MAG: flap endonuclease-1 [Nanoarchaeota archaeon]|nr:flap endonuclease-1 [Nanoarchaeota archaeon]
MGVQITELLEKKEIKLDDLKNKTLAVDASLFLYQFITTIRGRDGSLLTDSKGNVTSHLVGLFSRTTSLMSRDIKLVYVFDGKAPKLKEAERERRKGVKIDAQKKYEAALKKEDLDEMKKYAARTSRLTGEMIDESKKLLSALGVPYVEAPSEGEAQASFMVENHDCYAVASQDADCLMFGAPKLIRNISIAGKKKKINQLNYQTVEPELINLKDVLHHLGINQEQLIALCMLVGTDYNYGGIKGIGPKNALKLVRQHKESDFGKMFKEAKWDENFDFLWRDVFETIKNIPTTKDYKISFKEVDLEKLKRLLIDEHDFSDERINSAVSKLVGQQSAKKQKSIFDY